MVVLLNLYWFFRYFEFFLNLDFDLFFILVTLILILNQITVTKFFLLLICHYIRLLNRWSTGCKHLEHVLSSALANKIFRQHKIIFLEIESFRNSLLVITNWIITKTSQIIWVIVWTHKTLKFWRLLWISMLIWVFFLNWRAHETTSILLIFWAHFQRIILTRNSIHLQRIYFV